MWSVVYLPGARLERDKLSEKERAALRNAVEKLKSLGATLPFPHSSAAAGAESLRELRPRRGSSPWRALYRQIGDVFVIAAVAPEAQKDHRRFEQGCRAAEQRLTEVEE